MKVHLVRAGSESIGGYTKIEYQGDLSCLNVLSDNECEFILANDIMDSFSVSNIEHVVKSLLSKLRLNGTIVIGGTDIRLFCKHVVNSLINEKEAAEIIAKSQSMTSSNSMYDYMNGLGLNVKSLQISGVHYEITAVRNKN